VAIECRDRDGREDVQWIDALVGKRGDTGVSKVIGVSSSGFSGTAKKYAAATGIELREMLSISADDVFEWLEVREFTYEYRDILAPRLALSIDSKLPGEALELEGDLPILTRSKDGSRVTPQKVWETSADLQQIYADLIPRGSGAKEDEVILCFQDPSPYKVKTNLGFAPLKEFHVRGTFNVERRVYPIEKLNKYRTTNGETIAESAEVRVEHEGKQIVFGLISEESASGRRYTASARSADDRSALPPGMKTSLKLGSPHERSDF
jgi:hypothetical protein